jgi:DNA-binding MarR family transcriptional regulator
MATTAESSSSGSVPERRADQLDERELRAWRGMLRVHATLTKALDADLEAAHGLPLSSYEVLMHLFDAEGQRMRMSDLAASVILSRSGLTRLADRLERDGLIERQSCASDARGSFASLTEEGRRKLSAARETHLAGVRALFVDHFTPAELEVMGGAWERLLPGAVNAPGPACG